MAELVRAVVELVAREVMVDFGAGCGAFVGTGIGGIIGGCWGGGFGSGFGRGSERRGCFAAFGRGFSATCGCGGGDGGDATALGQSSILSWKQDGSSS